MSSGWYLPKRFGPRRFFGGDVLRRRRCLAGGVFDVGYLLLNGQLRRENIPTRPLDGRGMFPWNHVQHVPLMEDK